MPHKRLLTKPNLLQDCHGECRSLPTPTLCQTYSRLGFISMFCGCRDQFQPNQDHVWYLLNNARTLIDAFEQATRLMARRFDTAYDQSSLISLTVFLSIAAVVVLSALGLVIPMVLSADRLRNKVIDLFMDVPIVVVRKLRGLTRKQLEQINAEMNDDDDRQREIEAFDDESQVSDHGIHYSRIHASRYMALNVSEY